MLWVEGFLKPVVLVYGEFGFFHPGFNFPVNCFTFDQFSLRNSLKGQSTAVSKISYLISPKRRLLFSSKLLGSLAHLINP